MYSVCILYSEIKLSCNVAMPLHHDANCSQSDQISSRWKLPWDYQIIKKKLKGVKIKLCNTEFFSEFAFFLFFLHAQENSQFQEKYLVVKTPAQPHHSLNHNCSWDLKNIDGKLHNHKILYQAWGSNSAGYHENRRQRLTFWYT